MTMKKPTFCMFISAVAMASVLLVSCSRDGGESETLSSDEIIDHISYSELKGVTLHAGKTMY